MTGNDCSLPAVKSRRDVYAADYCTVTDIIEEKRSKLPSMSRSATKARVLLLHPGSIYLRAHNTTRIWHIYQRTMLSPVRPILYSPLLDAAAADCSTVQASKRITSRLLPAKNLGEEKYDWPSLRLTGAAATDVIALFVPRPSARWPGIIGSEMIQLTRWMVKTREKIQREYTRVYT